MIPVVVVAVPGYDTVPVLYLRYVVAHGCGRCFQDTVSTLFSVPFPFPFFFLSLF